MREQILEQSDNYILIYPDKYYNVGDALERQEFLQWIENYLTNGFEYITMLPTGLALFKKLILGSLNVLT
jgi:hypothetical protein